MELVLIRHGQSESNARLTTALDASLTQLGEKQAKATADYLIDSILDPDKTPVVLVSPFKRTLQTCTPLVVATHLDTAVYPMLCEYFTSEIDAYKRFEGMSKDIITAQFPHLCRADHLDFDACWWPEKTESLSDLYARMTRVSQDLWQRYSSGNHQVLIFSHAEPIGRLIEVLRKDEFNPGWPPWTENCGINRIVVESLDEPADVISLDDISHLEKLGLVSPVYG